EMGFFRPGDRGWKPQGGQAEPDKGVGFRASEKEGSPDTSYFGSVPKFEAKDGKGHGSEKRGSRDPEKDAAPKSPRVAGHNPAIRVWQKPEKVSRRDAMADPGTSSLGRRDVPEAEGDKV